MKERNSPSQIGSQPISEPALLLCILGMLSALVFLGGDACVFLALARPAPFGVQHLLLILPFGLNVAFFFLPAWFQRLLALRPMPSSTQSLLVLATLVAYCGLNILLIVILNDVLCPGCYFR